MEAQELVGKSKTRPSYFLFSRGINLSLAAYFLVGGDQFPSYHEISLPHVLNTCRKFLSALYRIIFVLHIWRLGDQI